MQEFTFCPVQLCRSILHNSKELYNLHYEKGEHRGDKPLSSLANFNPYDPITLLQFR